MVHSRGFNKGKPVRNRNQAEQQIRRHEAIPVVNLIPPLGLKLRGPPPRDAGYTCLKRAKSCALHVFTILLM